MLKYADNIARVYAHAIAMMLTMGASTQLFNAPVTPQLVLAVVLVGTSTLQYNLPRSMLLLEDGEIHERSSLITTSTECATPRERRARALDLGLECAPRTLRTGGCPTCEFTACAALRRARDWAARSVNAQGALPKSAPPRTTVARAIASCGEVCAAPPDSPPRVRLLHIHSSEASADEKPSTRI